MDLEEFDCSICLSTCNNAVESVCCGNLYCQECTGTIYQCPTCRREPFQAVPNRVLRKAIGKLEVACSKCQQMVQRGNVTDHELICPMSVYSCSRDGCSFEGVEDEFWQHLHTAHKRHVLNMYTNNDRKLNEATTSTKSCADAATQTFMNKSALANSAGHLVQVSKFNLKFYCGQRLTQPCGCGSVTRLFGNQGAGGDHTVCGPSYGCNCLACMELDLQIRTLPKGSLVNRIGNVSCRDEFGHFFCKREQEGSVCGDDNFQCQCCKSLDKQTVDEDCLYYDLLF